jgi:hypothetical protein
LLELLRQLYSVRSKAVHGADIKEYITVNRERRPAMHCLREGISIGLDIVASFLALGRIPNFDHLLLHG